MRARQEKNCIKPVPGKRWFPFFRFYGPLEPVYEEPGCSTIPKIISKPQR